MDDLGKQLKADQLTRREFEILRLVTDGLFNRAIAEQLFISVGTVKWYLKQIYCKLHVNSRSQTIGVTRTGGLIDRMRVAGELPRDMHNLEMPPQFELTLRGVFPG